MKLLMDVDALAKFSNWNLVAHVPGALGFDTSQCATVSSLRYRAQQSVHKPDQKLFHTPDAASQALEIIGQMCPLASLDPMQLAPFENIVGIDPGEAILFAEVLANPETFVLTGDKRALRALSGLEAGLRAGLSGRVVLIEQVLLRLLDQNDLEWVRRHVCPAKSLDKAVSAIMGSRCDANEESVRQGLASYIGEIARLFEPALIITT